MKNKSSDFRLDIRFIFLYCYYNIFLIIVFFVSLLCLWITKQKV